jgi:predicted HicB family RNase H-like nuclease
MIVVNQPLHQQIEAMADNKGMSVIELVQQFISYGMEALQ